MIRKSQLPYVIQSPSERINEIARMLSGETITEEAKAAAMKLLNG